MLALVTNTTQKIYFWNILKQNAAFFSTDVHSGQWLIFLFLLIYAGMSIGVDGAVVRGSDLKHNCPVALFCLTQLREAAWISPPDPTQDTGTYPSQLEMWKKHQTGRHTNDNETENSCWPPAARRLLLPSRPDTGGVGMVCPLSHNGSFVVRASKRPRAGRTLAVLTLPVHSPQSGLTPGSGLQLQHSPRQWAIEWVRLEKSGYSTLFLPCVLYTVLCFPLILFFFFFGEGWSVCTNQTRWNHCDAWFIVGWFWESRTTTKTQCSDLKSAVRWSQWLHSDSNSASKKVSEKCRGPLCQRRLHCPSLLLFSPRAVSILVTMSFYFMSIPINPRSSFLLSIPTAERVQGGF